VLDVLYTCITGQHDIRLVLLGGLLCVVGCFTAANLFVHAREATRKRGFALAAASATVFGAGVWATHFVAELAFTPGLPIAYDFNLTALSLLIAVAMTGLGMVIVLHFGQPVAGGLMIGAAVAAMHYTGMGALRVPADLVWRPGYVAASLVTGAVGAGAATWVLCRGPAWRFRIWATTLLVLAIVGLHFSAMAAITLVPNPDIAIPHAAVEPNMLAVLVAVVSLAIVALGMSVSVYEEQWARRATHEANDLRLSREHLARAQRISGVGSVVRDLRTGAMECSEELRHLFGIEDSGFEPAVDNLLTFVHPDDHPAVAAAARAAAANCIIVPPREFRIVRPGGEVRIVYREMDLVHDASGEPVQQIVTFKDITELRSLQEREKELHRQLLHSQKMEALGTLAGGVAHELNNALVPVLALAKLALDSLPSDHPVREDIVMIVGGSERARDLVKQILAYSRKQETPKRDIDLAAVTCEALQMLRAGLPATIQIVERIAAVPELRGDAGELHQVIINLVTNAAQAIGSKLGTVTVTLAPAGDNLCLSVADTGCGMDRATMERIFEPFFTTKEPGSGTGLGLSVIHGIVTRHGGNIDVDSEPGKGSVFHVVLPLPAAAEALAA
jgi:NO-binding membrane sensor protein with MHYT domain/nitrogen-specific signal transduction histidine kinase